MKKTEIGNAQHWLKTSMIRSFVIVIAVLSVIAAVTWSIIPSTPTESTHVVNINRLPVVAVMIG